MMHRDIRRADRRRVGRINRFALGMSLLVGVGVFGVSLIGVGAEKSSVTGGLKSTREATGPASGVTDADIVAFIDAQIRAAWSDSGLKPSLKATDGEFCRRVFLDVVGRLPTVGELEQYMKDSPATRKTKLLDRLLDSEEYTMDYAVNWSTIWSNLLIGRPMPRENRTLFNRAGMQQYLRSSFARNKPWDQMAFELVSATGTTKPGVEGYNGAVNFLIGKLQENATEATARTAKYFLGMQVQCTQCHNHPFNDYKQDQFWSMNAFFRQTKGNGVRMGRETDYATLRNDDFAGEGNTPKEAEIYFELRNGQMQVAYPKFVDGTPINPSGYVNEVDRRAELGKLIIKSEMFGKAIVNRMWAHFLGYGFTKPVDDMGPHNQPSHPELLDRLGKEFAAHNHDFKKLIRWIVLSEAYGLSSKITPGNKKDDPTLGEKPKFSHFYLRQMQAEQLYESLLTSTRIPGTKSGEGIDEKEDRKAQELAQFTLTFGNDEGEDATTFNGTIPQALMMMNGGMTREATDVKDGSMLKWLAQNSKSPSEAVEYLFLAAYSRKPSSGELGLSTALLSTRGNNLMTGLQDIWWALLNSNEFIFVH
jgi:hypothetical protein